MYLEREHDSLAEALQVMDTEEMAEVVGMACFVIDNMLQTIASAARVDRIDIWRQFTLYVASEAG